MRSSKRGVGSRRGGQGYRRNYGRSAGSIDERHSDGESITDNEGGDRQWQRTCQTSAHGSSQGRGGRVNISTKPIGYKLLESKSSATPRDAAMFCNQESFHVLLNDRSLNESRVDLMLTTINNALGADNSMSSYLEALKSTLLQEPVVFLRQICTQRLSRGLDSQPMRIDPLLRALQNYLNIFHHLCALDPLVSKSLIDQVKVVKQLIKAEVVDNHQLRGIYDLYRQATAEVERQEKEKEEREKRIKEMKRTGRMVLDEKPPDDFREISVYPTEDDLRNAVQLRPNCTDKAFESVDDYLDIQFRLLREDFVSTIRQGITEFRKNPTLRGPNRFRSGDIKIYENLLISTPRFGQTGLVYLAKLDTKSGMFQRINWKTSKRLIYGSLLCLSQDGFDKVNLFAVIAERNDDQIAKAGEFEIELLPDSQAAFDQLTNKLAPFIAVESTAYFESYKHVLTGMQKLSAINFAFAKHIVRLETVVASPAYSKAMEVLYRFITATNKVTAPVLIFREYGKEWPSAKKLGFNESQYEAYKMALTKEFVVIQGPPGTGKTFVGLRIVETLLYNLYGVPSTDKKTTELLSCSAAANSKHARREKDFNKSKRESLCSKRILNQILIVCYTNHALDQFLEGMLNFCPLKDMVRVGSRSKNELLAQCNLKNRKEKSRGQLGISYFQHRDKLASFLKEQSIDKINEEIKNTKTALFLYEHPGLFEDFPELFAQIQDYADDLEDNGVEGDAMFHWLHIPPPPAEVLVQVGKKQQPVLTSATENAVGDSIDLKGDREIENRLLDLDEDDDDRLKQHSQEAAAFTYRSDGNDKGFTKVETKKTKHLANLKLQRKIKSSDIMTDDKVEELRVQIAEGQLNITTDLSVEDRWRLYRHLVDHHRNYMVPAMKTSQENYRKLLNVGNDLRMQQEIDALKKARVIGMTTTGAARLQTVLQTVGPEIVVVEEAAEVLEAHIVTALSKHCLHLILIGDHKQLKPNPTVYDLAVKYHLDLSLFERMVNNGLPVSSLNIQHRMRPEISKYIRGHVYEKLDDHESVLDRDQVEGMMSPVYFFNHQSPEKSDEGTMSKTNEFEAGMVVGLTRYLLQQESYKPEDITIITMYTGQLLLIKSYMPRKEFEGVKITSVDNFQGEENKIVIISVVRSNTEGKLGFVKIENRVCVSLSRAQYGMYVFGNFDMLSKGSSLWRKIVDEATEVNELGKTLVLSCQIHGNLAKIENAVDFRRKAPTGGCELKCDTVLKCGHICKRKCHSKDWKHERYQCTEPCTKPRRLCNHPCTAMCHEDCPLCCTMLDTTLPCGHQRREVCHKLVQKDYIPPCLELCPTPLPCGHSCGNKCSKPCTERCKVRVERMCSKCQEIKSMTCHEATEMLNSLSDASLKYSYQCDTPCDTVLPCGHVCPGTCYKCHIEHQTCPRVCGKMLKCGHKCDKPCQDCTDRGECWACNQRCSIVCSHGVQCSQECANICVFTITSEDKRCQFGCKHSKCERDCGEACSIVPCTKSCDKMVVCKRCRQAYRCVGFCGEPCPILCLECDQPRLIEVLNHQLPVVVPDITVATKWIVLEDCQHLVSAEYMDELVFGAEAESLVTCPYSGCRAALINTRRYITRIRPVTYGTHIVEVPAEVEPIVKNKTKTKKASNHKTSAMTELENSLSAQLFVQPAREFESEFSSRESGKPHAPAREFESKFSARESGNLHALHPDRRTASAMSNRASSFSNAFSSPTPERKLTAKERRRENPRGPPKRPSWMTVLERQADFDASLQSMTEQLRDMQTDDSTDDAQKKTRSGTRRHPLGFSTKLTKSRPQQHRENSPLFGEESYEYDFGNSNEESSLESL